LSAVATPEPEQGNPPVAPAPSAAGDSSAARASGEGGTADTAPAKPKKKRKLWKKILLGLAIAFPIGVLALWIAIHRVEWLGPWLADAGRSVVGNDAIAKLEDWAYGAQDEFSTATRGDEKPTAHWEVPEAPTSLADDAHAHAFPKFVPVDVEPMFSSFAAPGDGKWVPMIDPHLPDEPPPMWKTLLHPDKKRGWALVAIVAVDLDEVRLHLVAGMYEPMTKLPEAKEHTRTGIIAPADLPRALAAFNGGFKTTHGNYGMKAEGVLFVEPRKNACAIAAYPGDKLDIRSWEALEPTRDQMVWFRETPACMFEDGVMHKGLVAEENTLWGATLDKDTVIRRSAIGMSEDKKTLFIGISEATTATAIAKAMHHAGAYQVAQLDVNWSYPKFVTIEPRDGSLADPKVKAIIDGFEYTEDDYVKKPMARDFFYLTRKAPDELPR
jgi:hypothetical protein